MGSFIDVDRGSTVMDKDGNYYCIDSMQGGVSIWKMDSEEAEEAKEDAEEYGVEIPIVRVLS